MDIWSKEFAGRPEHLGEVRRFAIAVLGDHDAAHTVALIADELAANAVKHTVSGVPGGEFVVRLAVFGGWCRVRVDDQGGPMSPSLHAAGDDEEAGRGLAIVDMLAERWGVEGDERSRSVWADILFGKVPTVPGPAGPGASDSPGLGLPRQTRVKKRVGTATDDGKC